MQILRTIVFVLFFGFFVKLYTMLPGNAEPSSRVLLEIFIGIFGLLFLFEVVKMCLRRIG